MIPETRAPRGEARGSEIINVLASSIDKSEITENLIHLQAERLRRRFILSDALAVTTAELAFANWRRFA